VVIEAERPHSRHARLSVPAASRQLGRRRRGDAEALREKIQRAMKDYADRPDTFWLDLAKRWRETPHGA
jgi:hypothetical protein